jgi:hypothetical protein
VDQWVTKVAAERPWPQDKTRKVHEVAAEEKLKLLMLPANPFPTEESADVTVGKTPYVRFDLNDYSVPHAYVQRTLTVLASLSEVRILASTQVIAEHERSWDCGTAIEDKRHIEQLIQTKRRSKTQRCTDRLLQVSPSSRAFLELAAERGANLGRLTQQLVELLDAHGAYDFEEALVDVIEHDRIHLGAVRHVLDRNRTARGLPPAVAAPASPTRHAHLVVKPHDLGSYDHIDLEDQ